MLKLATAMTAALALAVPSSAAGAGFKEPVKVLWQHTGAEGYYFGWVVSPLEDVNRDGVTDAIIAEPGNNAAGGDAGTTWIYSGRTGAPLARFGGKPGDQSAFSVADVGDLNRDGVHDVLSGAPRQLGDTEGHAYLISGRNGSLLHTFAGEVTGDSYGTAVSSAGDVNRDGRPDLLVGAAAHPGGGIAYVYSGRTFKLLYKIPPPDATHAFGYGTGVTDDVNRDRVPDLIVGGGGTAYVFSGRDGTLLHSWTGAAGDGLGPGRGAGDVNGDHRPDLAIGSYLNSDGGDERGQDRALLGRDRREAAHDHLDDVAGEPGVRRGRRRRRQSRPPPRPARLGAEGDTVYLIAGNRRRR